MNEEELHTLHVNDLFDLMVKSLTELSAMHKIRPDKLAIMSKQKYLELIQRIIVAKRSEFPPG